MAVLVEANSVVLRASAVESKYPGGFEALARNAPNPTLCTDGDLIRVGFMALSDVNEYILELEAAGLNYLENDEAEDFVVVDQQRGFCAKCNWAEFGTIRESDDHKGPVAACRAVDSENHGLWTPDGWQYEGSLSQTFGYVPSEHLDRSLTFLRHERGLDVYLSALTGEEVYVGRTHKTP